MTLKAKKWAFGRAAAVAGLLCAPDAPAAEYTDPETEEAWGVDLEEPALEQRVGRLPRPREGWRGAKTGVGDPVMHEWVLPTAGTYHISCFPVSEPALRFHLTLEDRTSGNILFRGAARSTNLVVDVDKRTEVVARLANLESNGDDRYVLRVQKWS